MKHLGDITKINGAEIEPVDVITGGSPCQDLSVAGKRAGLDGERSGLFMEQVRIVKEMRASEIQRGRRGVFIRPRWLVWENVYGAHSSNKGKDFQAVLTEIVRIVNPNAPDVPLPEKGKWTKSGCLMGYGDDGQPFSISYRLHDAQFWGKAVYADGRVLVRGTPQRRKRLALVADFGGLSAPEILFERKGLSGYFEQSEQTREETSARTVRCPDGASYTLKVRGGVEIDSAGKRAGKGALVQEEKAGTIGVSQDQTLITYRKTAHPRNSEEGQGYEQTNVSDTLNIYDNTEARTPTIVLDARGNGDGKVAPTITGDHQNRITDYTAIAIGCYNQAVTGSVTKSLSNKATDSDHIPCVVYGLDRASYNQGKNAQFDFSVEEEKIGAQTAKGPGAVFDSVVRRLTPLEVERLQGFPDGWTNIGEWTDSKGKKHKDADSPRYKALGNSIALPFWFWLLRRIAAQYERPATLGSLFDGIGGFPLCWERCNGKGTARWASEIEEFCIAVTKERFGDD